MDLEIAGVRRDLRRVDSAGGGRRLHDPRSRALALGEAEGQAVLSRPRAARRALRAGDAARAAARDPAPALRGGSRRIPCCGDESEAPALLKSTAGRDRGPARRHVLAGWLEAQGRHAWLADGPPLAEAAAALQASFDAGARGFTPISSRADPAEQVARGPGGDGQVADRGLTRHGRYVPRAGEARMIARDNSKTRMSAHHHSPRHRDRPGTPDIPDADRPSPPRCRAIPEAAAASPGRSPRPDVLLTSPWKRARRPRRYSPRPGAARSRRTPPPSRAAARRRHAALHRYRNATVAVVGHEPWLSALLARLLGTPRTSGWSSRKAGWPSWTSKVGLGGAGMTCPDGPACPGRRPRHAAAPVTSPPRSRGESRHHVGGEPTIMRPGIPGSPP